VCVCVQVLSLHAALERTLLCSNHTASYEPMSLAHSLWLSYPAVHNFSLEDFIQDSLCVCLPVPVYVCVHVRDRVHVCACTRAHAVRGARFGHQGHMVAKKPHPDHTATLVSTSWPQWQTLCIKYMKKKATSWPHCPTGIHLIATLPYYLYTISVSIYTHVYTYVHTLSPHCQHTSYIRVYTLYTDTWAYIWCMLAVWWKCTYIRMYV